METTQDQQAGAAGPVPEHHDGRPTVGSYVGTVALVGLGLAFIEEELLAGMAIGVAAMAFPNLMPRLGAAMRPLLKSAVRAGYGVAARTRETVAEMGEQFQDVVAEVRAEQEQGATWGETSHQEPSAETAAAATAEHGGESERGKGKRAGKSTPEGTEGQ